MRLVHGTEKHTFSFKKCSAFQFVKRKVRRWMRNPKVSVEKPQAKALLSPCPKCQDGQDLWYTHFPTSYACCPYSPGGYYLPHPPSPLCQPCMPGPRDKTKNCKVRKWKMLSRHHSDGKAKEAEPESHMVCPLAMSPFLENPVLMECSICNGPFITYSSEEAWQPRQRTQAMDLYYHGESETDYGCTSDANDFGNVDLHNNIWQHRLKFLAQYVLSLLSALHEPSGAVRRERELNHSVLMGSLILPAKQTEFRVSLDGNFALIRLFARVDESPPTAVWYKREDSAAEEFSTAFVWLFLGLCPSWKTTATVMTIQTETSVSAPAMTYSKTRGLVASLSAFMKQRKMGLNDFIQKLATSSYACKHPEVDSILTLTPPQDSELMTSNPSPPPSPSQQINLGPSSNPTAKPSDFNFLKVIGKGSFGKVLLARHRGDDKFYAVKVLQKKAILKKKEEKHIMSERNVLLKNVKHPFLVGLHYSFQTADKLYFVLDYINGGELFYHLQRERCFLEPRARFYAAEIASALGYLHSLNIVYRDLKPENILLDSQGHIILTDFGLCKENIEPNGTTSTFCGTPEYLAPEVLHKQPYDRTVDWWCLGAVLYEMLYGLPPFYSRNTAEMYDNILNKPLQLKPNISNAARHLLEGLLQKDRTKRLGCTDDFNEIKNHMFFSPINWDDLNAKKLTPPFNPNVTGPNDLRHFDPEFTDEPVPSSIGCSPDSTLVTASISDAAEAFLGFSYAPTMDSYL
ncbi:Serine/threonine-protein kinase Sgk1 [Bagarius yarrelli]|uniref:Serine/threonine-protein kinase Sgk1 n=1 Tax=Bagarius yarrelli TaxID=175774 RepID=A0A556UYS2_BAGYA|nr:Serine/threonine-protein kinase Sgk1 [Bagarius yarrelli]